MIELNKWESQFVYLSKHYIEIETGKKDADFRVMLKNLWSNKYGIFPEYVDFKDIAVELLRIVKKVKPDFNVSNFILKMSPDQYGSKKYTDNKTYLERVCWVCLYDYLSPLQLKEYDMNGDFILLIKLQPFDINSFNYLK